MAAGQPISAEPPPRVARDVMAFGQETGRALSDGRIVGRAEPFAKVFPSSRAVKRAVGAVAWAVLEDIALDARIDDAGRLVSETNVRRIAENLALNKDTVTRHLGRLRDHGFVLQEEARGDGSGRWEPCRYVLDPSACVERFTTTPSRGAAAENPRSSPCPRFSDTDERATVSEATGHGDTGHGGFGHHIEHGDVGEQHAARAGAGTRPAAAEPGAGETEAADAAAECASGSEVPADADADAVGSGPAGDPAESASPGSLIGQPLEPEAVQPAEDLRERLVAAGVAGHVAADLVSRHAPERIEQALAVAAWRPARNTAGWIVTALRDDWDLTDRLAEARAAQARREDADRTQQRLRHDAEVERGEQRRAEGWAQAVSAALDDDQLARAVELATTTVPGVGRRSVPVAHAELLAWAVAASQRFADGPLATALAVALDQRLDLRDDVAAAQALPDPPAPELPAAACLRQRLAALFDSDSLLSVDREKELNR